MLAGPPIVVRIVNGGPDWTAIVAVISSGVLGLLGLGAAVWQARQGWRRETDRAKLADKRTLYAKCIAVLNAGQNAEIRGELVEASGVKDLAVADSRIAALQESLAVVSEVRLIAPSAVANLAQAAYLEIYYHSRQGDRRARLPLFAGAMGDMLAAMREDLGEAPIADDPATEALAAQVIPNAPGAAAGAAEAGA